MARTLLTSQRNQIFLHIKESGLSPDEFAWRTTSSVYAVGTVPVLLHTPTKYYFVFDGGDSFPFISTMSPARDRAKETFFGKAWGSGQSAQFVKFLEWLDYLKRESSMPDLWDSLLSEASKLGGPETSGSEVNTQFSPAEREKIRARLIEIRVFLTKNHSLNDEQLGIIAKRLEYLEEAATRVGRRDWSGLLLSSLVGIALEAGLKSTAAQELMRFAFGIFADLLGRAQTLLR